MRLFDNRVIVALVNLVFSRKRMGLIQVFVKNEGRELLGKRNSNFIKLLIVLFITYLALGLSKGSLDYLEEKMDDPFIKTMSTSIPAAMAYNAEEYIEELNDSLLKVEYLFDQASGHFRFGLMIFNEKQESPMDCYGRSISQEDPVIDQVLQNRNLIKGSGFRSEKDYGLIVTRNLMEKLNLALDESYLQLHISTMGREKFLVPIPIVAIVEKLPGKNEFMATNHMYLQYNYTDKQPFSPLFTFGLKLTVKDVDDGRQFRQTVDDFHKRYGFENLDPDYQLDTNYMAYQTRMDLRIDYFPLPPWEVLDSIYILLKADKQMEKFNFFRSYDYLLEQKVNVSSRYDYLSLHLNSLDSITPLANYLKTNYRIEIGMEQVKSKENYNFISKLTYFIITILVGFSIFSIGLFISNIIQAHIQSIIMNLGTYKAFGLHNHTVVSIYSFITVYFVLIAMILSFIMAWLIGNLNIGSVVFGIIGSKPEDGFKYFDISNIYTLAMTLLCLIYTFYQVRITIFKLINKSPSKLIYNK